MFDIVILTDKRYVNPSKKDWYTNQVLLEDDILKNALEKKGLNVSKKDWTDPNFKWENTRYAIFRTTWDYFEKFNEFFDWIEKTKYKTTFINSSDIINWNINKKYLNDLANNGVNIPPTIFLNKNKKITLSELFKETKWKEAVIKPAISGAARNTYRISANNCSKYEEIFYNLITQENILFQEFMNNITSEGEISLIMIGNEYTHAVRKNAKDGDFRVQDDHGGSVIIHTASKEEILFAKHCIKATTFQPIFARVDIVSDNNNQLSLCELELIEPELWFRNNPKAATLLAEEIVNLISSK